MATDKELLTELAEHTRTLVQVCKTASTVLSEEFRDMITGPASIVEDVLAKIPSPSSWDGSFRDEDFEVTPFRTDYQGANEDPLGARVLHKPTDLAVEAYAGQNHAANARSARKSLEIRVKNHYRGLTA